MLDKRYDHRAVESGKYEKWKEKGYFKADNQSNKPPFCIVIPPPNVTGKLHIGHAWDNTIQDIAIRYRKLKGDDTLYLPGMDHAGIATEAKVMEKLRHQGVDTTKLTREEFLKWAWSWKDEYADSIHKQWAKMGLALDYSRERFTLDEGCNYAVRKVFVDLYNQGLIYQGYKIINWDPVQKTALSNIEVIHQDDQGYMYYFKYPIFGSTQYLTVATTRPETMFGDVCVVVNPKDDRYTNIVGQKVINPANGEIIPIIADEYVDINFGTGAMKCTPAHDPNDFIIGSKYHLDMPIIMNEDATMNERCGKYCGMDRFACREKLLEDIRAAGNFIRMEEIIHPVGHSERSGAVIEPMLSKQWFIRIRSLAEQAIANQKTNSKVQFIPKRFEKSFIQWMEKAEDWCISRQLWWGHRIPAYYNKHDGSVIVSMDPPADIENYIQDEDVLDTWFSSALWPFSTLGWPNQTADFDRYFPTSVLATGYDIIFFWVSRMIFQSLHFTGREPFKKVVIHGLVRDSQGRKMSKSLGNGVDPIQIIDQYGADALRYFLTTNSTPGQDMRFIEEKINAATNYLNKIWNSARYVLSILPADFTPIKDLSSLKLMVADQWILTRLEKTIHSVTTNMDKYDYNVASSFLYNFVYDDFCSSYLELSKVSLTIDSENKNSTYQVLYYCLKSIILMIYPYTPFIAEELYQHLPNHLESIMLENYPVYRKKLMRTDCDKDIDLLLLFIKDIRSYKIENKLAPNTDLEIIFRFPVQLFSDFSTYFKRFSFSTNISFGDTHSKKGELYVHDGFEMLVCSNKSLDDTLEKLEKDIALEKSEIERCEKMLSNPNFMSKAPKEKIAIEQEKLEKHRTNLKLLETNKGKLLNR